MRERISFLQRIKPSNISQRVVVMVNSSIRGCAKPEALLSWNPKPAMLLSEFTTDAIMTSKCAVNI